MTVLYFTAVWCGPCMWFAPVLDVVLQEFPTYMLLKYDIDDNLSLATRYDVTGLPTLILVNDNVEVKRHVGALMEDDLRAWLTDV